MGGKFQSNSQLLAILDNMPYMAWYKDAEGRFVAINQPFADSIGKPREEIIGKTDFDVWPYKNALSYTADDAEVMRTRQKKTVDEPIDDKTGGKWFETFKSPAFDDQGNVIGTIGMSKDITKRMHFQMELERQKRFIKSMIDAIPDLIFFKDKNSVYMGCNEAFASQFIGLAEAEIIGKTDGDFLNDTELAEFFRSKDREALALGRTSINEETIRLQNGEYIDVETSKTPFYNENGEAAGLIGISRDITSRKLNERKIREQSEYAEMLLRMVPSAVYTLDNHMRITGWNDMAEAITGYKAEEVMGKSAGNFYFHPCRENCGLFADPIVAPEFNITCKIRNKNGEVKYILKNVDVIHNDKGEIIGRVECFDDITERVMVEDQLKDSELRLNLAIGSG
ncbi:MAG: PAS domain-containing protein, partial [Pseudomonadota bacterium]